MYNLMVSYDCGITYSLKRQAEEPEQFDAECDELDAQGLRWAIEDESGKPVHRVCAIHRGICDFMARLRDTQEDPNA